jgi:hypothetical protein
MGQSNSQNGSQETEFLTISLSFSPIIPNGPPTYWGVLSTFRVLALVNPFWKCLDLTDISRHMFS